MNKNNDKFIFVHVPKTAGTTFIKILNVIYAGKTCRDYKDNRGNKSNYIGTMGIDNCDIIYGHFTADKYKHMNRPQIAFVRDPVERLISEYFYKPCDAKDILEYVDNKDRFAVQEVKSVNLLYDYILDISYFDLILITEQFEKSLVLFEKWSGIEIPKSYIHSKVNKEKEILGEDIRKQLKKKLEKDYEVYYRVLERWWKNEK